MRINTTLHESQLKKRTELTFLLVVCAIVFLSKMPPYITALTLILTIFIYVYQRLFRTSEVTLTQIVQFDKQTWRWVVLNPKRNQKSRMQQGRLLSVHQWFFVMSIRFETLDKHEWVIKSYVIWRDQVDATHWRRLIVLARFWSNDWNESHSSQGFDKNSGL